MGVKWGWIEQVKGAILMVLEAGGRIWESGACGGCWNVGIEMARGMVAWQI